MVTQIDSMYVAIEAVFLLLHIGTCDGHLVDSVDGVAHTLPINEDSLVLHEYEVLGELNCDLEVHCIVQWRPLCVLGWYWKCTTESRATGTSIKIPFTQTQTPRGFLLVTQMH